MDLTPIAESWIWYWLAKDDIGNLPGPGSTEAVDDLVRRDAGLGLSVILNILERIEAAPASTSFEALAAGPLEDLLVHHGPAIIDRVEAQARSDARFNLLLGGVWPNAIAPDVWARVEAIRREVW